MVRVTWNDAAIHDLANSIDGPVGKWLEQKMLEMTATVEAAAPIQKPQNFSRGRSSSSYMPRSLGYLKGSVRPHMGYTKTGRLFAGTNAAYGPTLFLERPARTMHEVIPFMSAALYAVTIE